MRAVSSPNLRLICFPYAGGSANLFRSWANHLPYDVELYAVELPGRQRRFSEPLIGDLSVVLKNLEHSLEKLEGVPFVFFGHSLGALVCFELTRRLRARHRQGPLYLYVSGAAAPQIPRRDEPMSNLPDADFLERLSRLGGLPSEVLAHRELVDLVLPALRADIAMSETWTSSQEPALDIGITVFSGSNDIGVSRDEAEAWRGQTSLGLAVHEFEGDHFFIHEHVSKVLSHICRDLSAWVFTLERCA
ncbi:MAG: alpha/beta fold hydrolase [Myxococcota bacterium]|nr:alpha/beta fold hydrolase [Myxococcota bacterium]